MTRQASPQVAEDDEKRHHRNACFPLREQHVRTDPMPPRVVYTLPEGWRSWLPVGSTFILLAVLGFFALYATGNITNSYTDNFASLACALLTAIPVHEILHAVLFLRYGEKPVRNPKRIAVNAPDARMNYRHYETVLLAPSTGIIVAACASLYLADSLKTWAAATVALTAAWTIHDICRAVAVHRNDHSLLWADCPETAEGWDPNPPTQNSA